MTILARIDAVSRRLVCAGTLALALVTTTQSSAKEGGSSNSASMMMTPWGCSDKAPNELSPMPKELAADGSAVIPIVVCFSANEAVVLAQEALVSVPATVSNRALSYRTAFPGSNVLTASVVARAVAGVLSPASSNPEIRLALSSEQRTEPVSVIVSSDHSRGGMVNYVWSNPVAAVMGSPFTIHLAAPFEEMAKISIGQGERKTTRRWDEAQLTRASDGGTIITVVPLMAGKNVYFRLVAFTRDDRFSLDTFSIPVSLPTRKPLGLFVVSGWSPSTSNGVPLHMAPGSTYPLWPVATFAACPEEEVEVKDYVTYRVIQDDKSPVLELHSTDSYTALRNGHAIVEMNFAGFITLLPIEVSDSSPWPYH